MKSRITGNINCKTEAEIDECKSILNKFNIEHGCNGNAIKINGHVKTTPMFDREGLERMLYYSLRRFGKTNISVGVQR